MAKKKQRQQQKQKRMSPLGPQETVRDGTAPPHPFLANGNVHIFVDDQNLFFGIVNQHYGAGFRIDFGRLLLNACRDGTGKPRFISSAYIAGVIPDDDHFWKVAEARGFTVRRGYLAKNRSKQDDAYLITDLMSTLYEQPGPSTIILVAGDADYMPPLKKALEKGWRTEVAFIDRGIAGALSGVAHQFRIIDPRSIQHYPDFSI